MTTEMCPSCHHPLDRREGGGYICQYCTKTGEEAPPLPSCPECRQPMWLLQDFLGCTDCSVVFHAVSCSRSLCEAWLVPVGGVLHCPVCGMPESVAPSAMAGAS